MKEDDARKLANLGRMQDKLNRIIKGIEDLRAGSVPADLSDRLRQIEMDAIAAKKFSSALGPLKDGVNSSLPAADSEKQTIMVVDDEEMVLQVTCIIISKMGLRPLAFKSSSKALDYYRDHHRTVSLVLLDMIMPEMNGKELFLSMKEINPSVKAILLSGWIDKDENENINDIGLVDFLHKPIEKAVLESNILQALRN